MKTRILAVVIPVAMFACAPQVKDCVKIQVAVQLACGADPESAECARALKLSEERCGTAPTPPPVEPPPVEPPPVEPPPVEPPPVEPPPAQDPPCPDVVKNAIENGRREYKANPHGAHVWDSTPRVCGDPAVSEAVGRPTQYCVPLGPESPEGTPNFRTTCEALFNGGPTPRWEARNGASLDPADGLTWQPRVKGPGQIRVCDRFGRTCSDWKSVE